MPCSLTLNDFLALLTDSGVVLEVIPRRRQGGVGGTGGGGGWWQAHVTTHVGPPPFPVLSEKEVSN